MIKKTIIIFFLMCGVCFAATISKKNLTPKVDYVSDGNVFMRVNMTCSEENTELPKVTNNHFVLSNITNCKLDDTNTFERSIYLPEAIVYEEEISKEDLEDRVVQLEKFITDNQLSVPKVRSISE